MRSWALRPKVGEPQASSSSLVCSGPSSLSPVMKAMLSQPTLPGYDELSSVNLPSQFSLPRFHGER